MKSDSVIQLITGEKAISIITNPKPQNLLQPTETYRVERTTSTNVPQAAPQDDTQSDTQGINH